MRPESRVRGARPATAASWFALGNALMSSPVAARNSVPRVGPNPGMLVMMAVKSFLDHFVGVVDFVIEGHHLLGESGDHLGSDVLSCNDGVLGVGGRDCALGDGGGVAGLVVSQPGLESGRAESSQPIGVFGSRPAGSARLG